MRVPHVPRAQALDDGDEEIAFFPGYDTPGGGSYPVTNRYRHGHVYFLRSFLRRHFSVVDRCILSRHW